MEADLDKPGIPRPSFVMSVEMSPRVGPVDANDVKKNLYGDFSSTADISQRDSLESKERVHVCLRIRPFMQPDKEIDSQDCISVVDSTSILLKAPKSSMVFRLSEKNLGQMVQKFTFSQVFGPETTQEEFFEGTVKQPVQDFLKGHSRLIFTYGVTNAGKTYTYQGTDEDIGVLPRALDMLFKCIQGRLYPEMNLKPFRCREHKKLSKEEVKEEMAVKNSLLRLMKEVDYNGINGNCSRTAGNSEVLEEPLKEAEQSNMEDERGAKYSVWVSFCEIYNECIYDLLLPISNDKRRKLLRLAQDVKGCSYVKDLQWIQVSNSKEAFRLMKLGLKHQSFASTKLNANSSRSHSIFTVKMLKIDSGATRVMQVSELFLCDLAGSERCTKTCNEGERLKESGNINTSLHILGKCIHALKISQQSKLQQHIPFRESKLTHFFQGFFSGKGKVCMIVNVSQSASAYDETLNVLKFSAIAQKVMVLDSSNSQAESLDQMSVKSNSELNTEEGVPLPVRRATMRWERTLEDVMEDEEELLADSGGGGVHEEISMTKNILGKEVEPEVIEEAISEEEEDSDVVMKKEDYQRLLNIVEDLKNKLIDERKDKLLLELRIREEVMQECSQYLAKKESDLRAFIDRREEMMEDNCEERIQIYKDLVKGRILLTNGKEGAEETLSNEQDETLGNEARESGNAADLVCMVESLQQNVTDIKQKAETVFDLLCASEDPQTTIELLGKQLAELTAELSKTREEVLCRSKEMKIQENKLSESAKVLQGVTEKMALQNKRIQELTQIVEQKNGEISRLQDLISHLETIIKDSEATIATIKQEMEHENSNKKTNCTQSESMEKYGRKRCLEREEEEEGPPAKQGPIKSNCKDDIETKKLEMQPREMVVLEEENRMQAINLATLEGQLEKEKIESEGFPGKINLSQKHVSSEERASDLSRELQQQQAYCGKIVSELAALKDTNKGQEEKIQALLKEMESASQTIAEKKSKVKAVEIKIGELSRLALQCPNVDVDLAHGEEVLGLPKEMLELPKERHEQTPINLGRKNSFHFSIENIWEVSKQIIHASAQKSNLIEDLRQQVGQLQRRTLDAEEEKHQLKLKLSETIHQVDAALQEKEGLLSQLRNLQQENALYSEKYRDAENEALGYLGKMKQMDGLLEECRTKEGKIACLEQTLKDKESAILVMERELKDMEGKLHTSESETKRLHDQELQLKEQVLELRSNLKDMEGKLHTSESETKRLHDQELQLKEQVLELRSNLKDMEGKLHTSESETKRLHDQELQLKEQVLELRSNLKIQLQDMRREESKQTLEQLNKELLESNALSSRLQIEVQRKDEEYADLKEKLADTKKQIEQVQRQVCTMRTEEKILRNKVSDLEKIKNQLTEELDIKQRTIQQFNKEELNKKLEDVSKQFQRACQDLCSKDRIIEDMKLTLEEQEMTQAEQDQLLEAKLEESERLVAELEEWKRRCYELEKQKSINVECRSEESSKDELKRLQEKLEEYEEQQKMDRKKWLAEKMSLISQVKEAETHRNREMKRFAGDREHHARQLAEAEKLVTEKENDLQKWRTERDQLVAALEVQLSSLVSSNRQKDQEIEDLKKSTLNTCGKDYEITVEECRILSPERGDIKELKQLNSKQMDPLNGNDIGDTDSLLQRSSETSSAADIQIREQSETILDSCEVSAESEQTSRFPKPEMEIHFTPLQPNKMEVKHQGNPSVVTIKVPKAKKRKSSAMEEEDHFLKTENERNATSLANTNIWPDPLSRQKKKTASDPSLRKEYSLRKKHCVSSINSPGNAGGTLQKFGCFLQSSPTIIHSKAKKLMATIKSPKPTEEESVKENDLKPKRAKRKLYSTDISSPMEFSGHVIVMDQRESDHEIIKRRLRAKKPH